jgi:hypothetical protein
MVLEEIEEQYNNYLEIYEKLDDVANGLNQTAKDLLVNSLYLSVFTVFEDFLKRLIANYIDSKIYRGIKFGDLSLRIACNMFVNTEKPIKKIFEKSGDEQIKAFTYYFNLTNKELRKDELKKYIHYEFLHSNQLNGYYNDLFEQILGERDFLSNLKIPESGEKFDDLDLKVENNALKFLSEFTSKIRNNIAHENQSFKVQELLSFKDTIDIFLIIIEEIEKKYTKYTGFNIDQPDDNILDDF